MRALRSLTLSNVGAGNTGNRSNAHGVGLDGMLRVVTMTGVAFAITIALLVAATVLAHEPSQSPAPVVAPHVAAQPPSTPPPESPRAPLPQRREDVLASLGFGAASQQNHRFMEDCVDHGGRACCGQGGCCGVPETVLAPRLTMGLPLVKGALSTRAIERTLHRYVVTR